MTRIFLFYVLSILLLAEHNYTNALINEDSPYLQQHAHNPVNWYPWGKEAFEKAKKENKLIFLSIGYSTCHWCHVMEDESFKNEAVAKLLNNDYVSIKVDREEYPQIDKKYQQLFMSVYGKRGGWPLTVFMSPEAEAFHLETYIPVEEAYGLDGMLKMLPGFAKMYKEDQNNFVKLVDEHTKLLKEGSKKKSLKNKLTLSVIDQYMKEIEEEFDSKNGGFAKKPKFPEASKLALLLDIYKIYGNKEALDMAEFTLQKMAESGIYDQIGGGFFRYTTDKYWQMPHFEKMLYTNAELIPVYVTLYELTKKPLYKRVVSETIDQIESYFMQGGVYFSASDADSEGEEGGYFIYNYEEVKQALLDQKMKEMDVEEALAYLGIEEDGNIDGELSLAHITSSKEPLKLEEVKAYLKKLSAKRAFPFVDKKINTAWNAMMIKALFSASKLDEKYLELGKTRLKALLKLMRSEDTLYHQTLLGKEPKQKALLEDYAFMMDALIEGYLKTYNKEYLLGLKKLAKETESKFYKNEIWYLSDDGIDAVADFDDRYYTSALSMILEDFVRLASLTEELEFNEVVKKTLKESAAVLESNLVKA
ncbi:MAG: thioredoxin domain-containing protein, partial [Sulfurovum sp.]|nr:thioredoxin domain-containing protein [Sulfurovum sp.]